MHDICARLSCHTHPSIYYLYSLFIRVTGELEPISSEAGYTLGRSPVYCRTKTETWTAIHTHIHTCRQFRVARWPNLQVFGWSENRSAWRKPTQAQRDHANCTQKDFSRPTGSNVIVRWKQHLHLCATLISRIKSNLLFFFSLWVLKCFHSFVCKRMIFFFCLVSKT